MTNTEAVRRYRLRHPDRVRDTQKRWQARNPTYNRDHLRKPHIKTQSKWRHLRKRYGISPEDFFDLLEKQNRKCKICLLKFDGKKRICVDHCHTAGHVRGLLCVSCNRAIGMLGNSAATAKRLYEYLEREIIFNPAQLSL